jgi:hypothetical protein
MHGTDTRLDSDERPLILNGPLSDSSLSNGTLSNGSVRSLTRSLTSAWSLAVAAAIFAFALLVFQVGLMALGSGLEMFTRSFSGTH